MKVTRNKRSVTIICTDLEFEILSIAVDQIEAGDPMDVLKGRHIRRVFNMRTRDGQFLRVDEDRRDKPLSRAMQQSIDMMLASRGLRAGGTADGTRAKLEGKTT